MVAPHSLSLSLFPRSMGAQAGWDHQLRRNHKKEQVCEAARKSSCFGTRLPQLKGSDGPRPRVCGGREPLPAPGRGTPGPPPTTLVWLESKRARQRSNRNPGSFRLSAATRPAGRASEQVQSARRERATAKGVDLGRFPPSPPVAEKARRIALRPPRRGARPAGGFPGPSGKQLRRPHQWASGGLPDPSQALRNRPGSRALPEPAPPSPARLDGKTSG